MTQHTQANTAPPELSVQGNMEPPQPPSINPNTDSVHLLSAFLSPIPPVHTMPLPLDLSQALLMSSETF